MRRQFLYVLPLVGLLVLGLGTLGACTTSEEPEPAAPQEPAKQPVENPELGIGLTDIPDDFRLVSNDAEGIRLETKPNPEVASGTLWVTAGEEQRAGINLVKGVQEQKEYLESQPEGKFLGQIELVGPTGTAYSTRGRYQQDGTQMEEIRFLSLHPLQPDVNRMLILKYVYEVSGDTKERMDQAMAVLGEVVPASQAAPSEGESAIEEDASTDDAESTGS